MSNRYTIYVENDEISFYQVTFHLEDKQIESLLKFINQLKPVVPELTKLKGEE